MKDLVVIGAGPGGLTAAIYGKRAGLDLLVIEKLAPGGQVVNTYEVENYPGFVDPVSGWDLVSKMEAQARRLEAEITNGDIVSIEKDGDNSGNGAFKLTGSDGKVIEARSVIIATGAAHRKLGVSGEDEFSGRGVSYCGTCDGAFFKEKVIAVVGGGDTALEEADFLTRFGDKVYIIHRRDQFRGGKVLQERVLKHEKIIPVYDTVVDSINGTMKVESLSLRNKKTGEESKLEVDGVFIFVGVVANTGFLPEEILNKDGRVIVDINMRTSIKGLFAIGDLRVDSVMQIVTAAGDAATAVQRAYEYIADLS
ncbi:MAG: thioredoxin-disulfide reductase [bacterium]|nr:thioredoxin-disulfide reductase [bacterium]